MLRSVSLDLACLFLSTVASQASPVEAAGSGQSQAAPQQNPGVSGKYHVGDGVSPPKLVFAPDPEYSDQARRKRLQGTIVLSLTVIPREEHKMFAFCINSRKQ